MTPPTPIEQDGERYVFTGEVRPPKAHEYYSPSGSLVYSLIDEEK